jgi:hypothetical protein
MVHSLVLCLSIEPTMVTLERLSIHHEAQKAARSSSSKRSSIPSSKPRGIEYANTAEQGTCGRDRPILLTKTVGTLCEVCNSSLSSG